MFRKNNAEAKSEADEQLLNKPQLTEMGLGSGRHIARMSDARLMPAPVKLGRLVRWRKSDIDQWIKDGCPRCNRGPK
jgi:predicted DNA-binding transcriptional regulator AlpA